MDAALAVVEAVLDPFLSVPPQSVCTHLKEPLDHARLHTTFAATAASLVYSEDCMSACFVL